MGECVVTVPGIPPSWNELQRQHRMQQNRLAREWHNTVGWAAKAARAPRYERARVTLRYWFPDRRRRDPDNYSGKLVLDGLRAVGVLADDSFQHVQLRIEQAGVDRQRPRVEIVLEPWPEEVQAG